MYIQQLRLTNFKNYTVEKFDFSPTVNCIVGLNGMGKTNLLDAIYYICMTKSGFASNDRNVVLCGADFFRIEGHLLRNEKKLKIVAKVQPGKSKVIEKNQIPYHKLSEHIGELPIVMIAPDDTALAREGSEERRKFLDNTLSQCNPEYLKQLLIYNKILRHRNAALKEFALQKTYNAPLIKAYDQQILTPGNYIFKKRKQLVATISPIFNEFYQLLSNGQETVECVYTSQLEKDSFDTLLETSNQKDRLLQRTTCGVHKDNLSFKINGFPVKRFASQGQLKSFIIALKFAQFDQLRQIKSYMPLLLLDDIFDKLDANRVRNLIEMLLSKKFGQIFLTDTHEHRIPEILEQFTKSYKKFIIQNGHSV